jgi:hypothetical protein
MNKLLTLLVFTIVIFCAMPSCRLVKVMKKPIRKPADSTAIKMLKADTTTSKNVPLDTAIYTNAELIKMLEGVWNKPIQFNSFSAKAKMHYEGPEQKVDFTAHIRIRKDSVIWINISASILGLQAQVGRALITRDSLKWVNHLQKEVTLLPLKEASKLLPAPIDFATLQNFILGDALNKNGNITNVSALANTWAIEVLSDSIMQRITYNRSDTTLANAQMSMRRNFSLHGINQFTNYLPVDGHKFSFDREANIQNAGMQYYLGISFQSVDFDKDQDYPFSIPKNFSVVNY